MERVYFDRGTNLKKPDTIRNKKTSCPFCDVDNLENIIKQQDDMIWLKNKFSTIKDSDMTVIIETDKCESDMHEYSIESLSKLLEFAVVNWQQMETDERYKSAIMFKNKGRLSGGTLSHPHMQIIGFKHADGNKQIKLENVQGREVVLGNDISFNISTLPLVNFIEVNKQITNDYVSLAKFVKYMTNYFEDNFWGKVDASYNLFFYTLEDELYLKIIPRYPTSPITLGFGISQIYDDENIDAYVSRFEEYYLEYINK